MLARARMVAACCAALLASAGCCGALKCGDSCRVPSPYAGMKYENCCETCGGGYCSSCGGSKCGCGDKVTCGDACTCGAAGGCACGACAGSACSSSHGGCGGSGCACKNFAKHSCGSGRSSCWLTNQLCACAGCGELYFNEWYNDPPRCANMCDCYGNWIGPGSAGYYRAPYRSHHVDFAQQLSGAPPLELAEGESAGETVVDGADSGAPIETATPTADAEQEYDMR